MTDWVFPLTDEMYKLLVAGKKTIEGRVPDPAKPDKDYSRMDIGDKIIFSNLETKETTKVTVKYVKHYQTIENYLTMEGLRRTLPNVKTLEEGVKLFESFPGYKERAEKFGIYAIFFDENE